jgi:transcription initiation factor TFIID TATA-box-binding protein
MTGNPYDITIQNVVATGSLNQKIDLASILKTFPNVEYKREKFPGLCFRLKKPKTATLIFNTGKMVCTGAKSEKMARIAISKVANELKEKGIIDPVKPKVTVQNIVSSANLGLKIDLEVAADILENIMYEPEQFPGAVYRMSDPKTVLLLFSTGKIVVTGAKKKKQVFEAVKKIRALLSEYDLLY